MHLNFRDVSTTVIAKIILIRNGLTKQMWSGGVLIMQTKNHSYSENNLSF